MTSLSRIGSTAVALIAIAASQVVACKSGDELVNPPVVAVPDFVPETPDATSRYVSMQKGTVSGSRITIDIAITDVNEPITAIAIKLSYPSTFARFAGCTDGSLFPVAGTCYATETAPPGSGEVFLARSVGAASQAVTVIGTKVAMHVEFIVFGNSTGPIVFEATNLGGGDATAVLDVNGDPILMQWYAGTLAGH